MVVTCQYISFFLSFFTLDVFSPVIYHQESAKGNSTTSRYPYIYCCRCRPHTGLFHKFMILPISIC
jgi:hypothetical protein